MSAPKWIPNTPPAPPPPVFGVTLEADPDGVSVRVNLIDQAGVKTNFMLFTTGATGLMNITRLNTSPAFIAAAGIQNDGGLIAIGR